MPKNTQSVTIYVDPRIESTDGVHTYKNIHDVKISHDGDLTVCGQDGETVAYYVDGRWSGFHKTK